VDGVGAFDGGRAGSGRHLIGVEHRNGGN
jgi:hypothetical protein